MTPRLSALALAALAIGLLSPVAAAVTPLTPSIDAVDLYRPYAASVASWDGSTLFLSGGGIGEIDVTYPSTGVQHLSYTISVSTSVDMFSYPLYDWLGLSPAANQIWAQRNNFDAPRIGMTWEAYARNVAPGNRVTPADLILRGFHNWHHPSGAFAPTWSLGTAYDFDYIFDFDAQTTRMLVTVGGNPFVDRTWPSVFRPDLINFTSYAFTGDGQGGTVTVSNFSVTGVPEPALLPLLTGGLIVVRRRRA